MLLPSFRRQPFRWRKTTTGIAMNIVSILIAQMTSIRWIPSPNPHLPNSMSNIQYSCITHCHHLSPPRHCESNKPLTFLPQLGFSFLHRSDNHITNTSRRQPVQTGTRVKGFDNVEGLGTTVICTIQNSASWKGASDAEFWARGSSCGSR